MISLDDVITSFEDYFYPLDQMLKERMLNHPDPKAVLGKLAFLMDCENERRQHDRTALGTTS